MTIEVCQVLCGGPGLTLPDGADPIRVCYDNRLNLVSPREAMQSMLQSSRADVLVYTHDDLVIHDADWLDRIEALFTRDQVVAVGLGGALALGHPDLGKLPFTLAMLARRGYHSNQTDWRTHGGRETGERQVAVLDQFAMAVRREWLQDLGGWPSALTHHMLDAWLACQAARAGREIWITGVSCTHLGGRSSCGAAYAEASWLLGGSVESDHWLPHPWIAREFADVLPIQVHETMEIGP